MTGRPSVTNWIVSFGGGQYVSVLSLFIVSYLQADELYFFLIVSIQMLLLSCAFFRLDNAEEKNRKKNAWM
jgi:hypothetical protein